MISEGGSQSIIYRRKTIINFSSRLNLAAKKISYSIQRETSHKVLNFHISQVIYNIFSEKVDFFWSEDPFLSFLFVNFDKETSKI